MFILGFFRRCWHHFTAAQLQAANSNYHSSSNNASILMTKRDTQRQLVYRTCKGENISPESRCLTTCPTAGSAKDDHSIGYGGFKENVHARQEQVQPAQLLEPLAREGPMMNTLQSKPISVLVPQLRHQNRDYSKRGRGTQLQKCLQQRLHHRSTTL